ncbi:endoribonuclease Dicer homolog 3a isoform X1, partial [Tanacetum coccineum]
KDVIQAIEEKLGYEFGVKGLLLEAITHASCQDQGVRYRYQDDELLPTTCGSRILQNRGCHRALEPHQICDHPMDSDRDPHWNVIMLGSFRIL